MILSLYLHNDVIDTLQSFGELDDVVNKILDECSVGSFDFTNKPNCRERDGARRINVNITNEDYLIALNTYGVKSKHVSLRRLLYWFVENEIYCDLAWEQVNAYKDSDTERLKRQLVICQSDLTKLQMYNDKIGRNDGGIITHCLDLLKQFKEVLQ